MARASKKRYEDTLSIVHHQTSPAQTAMVSEQYVKLLLCEKGHETDKLRSTLQAAVNNGDLVRSKRYGCPRYARTTEESLLRVISAEEQRDNPNRKLIARCNQLLQRVGQ